MSCLARLPVLVGADAAEDVVFDRAEERELARGFVGFDDVAADRDEIDGTLGVMLLIDLDADFFHEAVSEERLIALGEGNNFADAVFCVYFHRRDILFVIVIIGGGVSRRFWGMVFIEVEGGVLRLLLAGGSAIGGEGDSEDEEGDKTVVHSVEMLGFLSFYKTSHRVGMAR